jgi:hypothetical protein
LTDRTTKIAFDPDQLLAFYDFPGRAPGACENYQSVESRFATVRNRSKITKGPGSRAAGIAMADKLIEAAQSRWRAVNAPHLAALVRAGAEFKDGKPVERRDESGGKDQAA